MTKLLYCIKMSLLSKKITYALPKGPIFGATQPENLNRFVQFVIYIYIPCWLTAPILSSAPKHDLALIDSLNMYKLVDKTVANATLIAFSKHIWYLSEDLVPLSIFSHNVSDTEKQQIADSILDQEDTGKYIHIHGEGFGKPNFFHLLVRKRKCYQSLLEVTRGPFLGSLKLIISS